MGEAVKKSYKILYLPTGDFIRSVYDVDKGLPCLCESEEVAFKLITSMCREVKPQHYGLMAYNDIIFPSIIKHFHIVEDT